MTHQAASPSFSGLDLRPELIAALDRSGLSIPTEVQRQAIPLVLAGKDLLVQSRTGTGKTLAFVLPLLNRIDPQIRDTQALVVAPTRELANQVGAVFARMGRNLGISVATLTGGVPYGEQLKALRSGVQVVVGTPGRLCDHLDRKTLNLRRSSFVVLDEADEILDMGFQEDLEKILDGLPSTRQSLLFSATLAEEIERLAHRHMHQPERLNLSVGMKASTSLSHVVCEVNRAFRYESLVNLLHVEQPELAILFCHTKLGTEDLARRLIAEGFKAGCLNGNLPQAVRTSTLEAFRQHDIALLVATDVAARGIDVRGISHIFNYEIPTGVETYIHRAGRAGRAGHEGRVVNIVTPADRGKMRGIALEAQLKIETRLLPTGAEVRQTLRDKFFETLTNRIEAGSLDDFRAFAADLLENLDPTSLVAALLQDVQSTSGHLAVGYDVEPPGRAIRKERETQAGHGGGKPPRKPPEAWPEQRQRGDRPDRKARPREANMIRLRFNVGKADRILPGHLVRQICRRAEIEGSAIGAISLFPHYSLVDVRSDVAQKVVAALNRPAVGEGSSWSVIMDPQG